MLVATVHVACKFTQKCMFSIFLTHIYMCVIQNDATNITQNALKNRKENWMIYGQLAGDS